MMRILAKAVKPQSRAGARWLGLCLLGMLLYSGAPAEGAGAAEAWVRHYSSEVTGSADFAFKAVADNEGNILLCGMTDDGITGSTDMLVIKYSGAGLGLWTNRYDGPGNSGDQPYAVAVDHNSNVFVTGSSDGDGGFTSDYATIAYSATGAPLWTNRYDGSGYGYDMASSIAVDRHGNVFVTGSSPGNEGFSDYATIAYSGAGVPLWTNRYDGAAGLDDSASGVAVDYDGNVFVTGTYATIAYSTAGVGLWTNRHNGLGSSGVAVDNSGNVFVIGGSEGALSDYTTIAYSGAGLPLWTNRYDGPDNNEDIPHALAVDNSGNVFVTGYSSDVTGYRDYATIAYSGAGVALWTNRYDGPGNAADQVSGIAVDTSGNVFVTGSSRGIEGHDYVTIAYSGTGVALWTNRYDGPGKSLDIGYSVAVDTSGNVFVTGSSIGLGRFNHDYATIAYSGAGVALWTNRYDGPGNGYDEVSAVAVDNIGNVFVTGSSVGDYVTVAYSAMGVPLWTNRYDGPESFDDYASAIAVDDNGNVFVTGQSAHNESLPDYVTIAYSGAGVALWTNRYDGPGSFSDIPSAIAVNHNGNVFVTGYSYGGPYPDYATIAYSAAGVALWTNRYSGPANSSDIPTGVAVDCNGNVFVTGHSFAQSYSDYATIAYSAAGVALWTNRYDGPENDSDMASAVAVNNTGDVFVTGSSVGSHGYYEYATVAYSGAGAALWTNRHNGLGRGYSSASAVAVDSSGNVFVTGFSVGSRIYSDYATIAYSGTGVALWTNRYSGPGDHDDYAYAIKVDNSGNVFVMGSSVGSEGNFDYATVAYSCAGVALWTNRYNGPANGDDLAPARAALAIGPGGAVYVTGSSDGNHGSDVIPDFATVKYVLQPQLGIQPLSAGASTVNLTLSGVPGSSWSIERSPKISSPWTYLGPALIGTNGRGDFQDANPPPEGAFYRATQP